MSLSEDQDRLWHYCSSRRSCWGSFSGFHFPRWRDLTCSPAWTYFRLGTARHFRFRCWTAPHFLTSSLHDCDASSDGFQSWHDSPDCSGCARSVRQAILEASACRWDHQGLKFLACCAKSQSSDSTWRVECFASSCRRDVFSWAENGLRVDSLCSDRRYQCLRVQWSSRSRGRSVQPRRTLDRGWVEVEAHRRQPHVCRDLFRPRWCPASVWGSAADCSTGNFRTLVRGFGWRGLRWRRSIATNLFATIQRQIFWPFFAAAWRRWRRPRWCKAGERRRRWRRWRRRQRLTLMRRPSRHRRRIRSSELLQEGLLQEVDLCGLGGFEARRSRWSLRCNLGILKSKITKKLSKNGLCKIKLPLCSCLVGLTMVG